VYGFLVLSFSPPPWSRYLSSGGLFSGFVGERIDLLVQRLSKLFCTVYVGRSGLAKVEISPLCWENEKLSLSVAGRSLPSHLGSCRLTATGHYIVFPPVISPGSPSSSNRVLFPLCPHTRPSSNLLPHVTWVSDHHTQSIYLHTDTCLLLLARWAVIRDRQTGRRTDRQDRIFDFVWISTCLPFRSLPLE